MFVILWTSTPLRFPLEPERKTTYLVHAADKFQPMTWPTQEAAQAVLDADTTMPPDKASVVPLAAYEDFLYRRKPKTDADV